MNFGALCVYFYSPPQYFPIKPWWNNSPTGSVEFRLSSLAHRSHASGLDSCHGEEERARAGRVGHRRRGSRAEAKLCIYQDILYFGGVALHRAFSRVPMATSGVAVVLPLQVRVPGSWCPRPSPIIRMTYESKDFVLWAGSGSIFSWV